MTFIAYTPGLQAPTHDFSTSSESFDAFRKIAEEFGFSMYELKYQDNNPFPQPWEAGLRIGQNIDALQLQYGMATGVWVGNSVGAHMLLEAADLLFAPPEQIILLNPVLGAQHKIVQLALGIGAPAIELLDKTISGDMSFPIPVANGSGYIPVDRGFFADENSVWVRAFEDETLQSMQTMGFSKNTTATLEVSKRRVAALRDNLKGVGITILVGENDPYCHSGDLAAFTRDVAPQAKVVKMPGGHEWQDNRRDFFRGAIAPFAPGRPAAKAKPATPDTPKA